MDDCNEFAGFHMESIALTTLVRWESATPDSCSPLLAKDIVKLVIEGQISLAWYHLPCAQKRSYPAIH